MRARAACALCTIVTVSLAAVLSGRGERPRATVQGGSTAAADGAPAKDAAPRTVSPSPSPPLETAAPVAAEYASGEAPSSRRRPRQPRPRTPAPPFNFGLQAAPGVAPRPRRALPPDRQREGFVDAERTATWAQEAGAEPRWHQPRGAPRDPSKLPLALIFTVDNRDPRAPDAKPFLRRAVAANILYAELAQRWQPPQLQRRFVYRYYTSDHLCGAAGSKQCPGEAAELAPGKQCCWSPDHILRAGPFASVWLKVVAMLHVVRNELPGPSDVGVYVDSDAFIDIVAAPVLPFDIANNQTVLPGILNGDAGLAIVHDQSWWRALLNHTATYRGRHTGGPPPPTDANGDYPSGVPNPETRKDGTGVAVNSGVLWLSPRPRGAAEKLLVDWLQRASKPSPLEIAQKTPLRFVWEWPWEQDRLNWIASEEPPGLAFHTASRLGGWKVFPGAKVPWGYGLVSHRNFKKEPYTADYCDQMFLNAAPSVDLLLGKGWGGRPIEDVVGKLLERLSPEPL
eukprot:TRINITY_DN30762_c0_g1_i2.p1 TRINITY_DN30762_c0_g1~~TRINITY_DN30762_c0_g1_i2.p1  ORF type:complete len:554 (+),score=96.13 TRINITY_DN30762_c0_g1_i2:132-1664(+)